MLNQLKAEIQNDPVSLGYASGGQFRTSSEVLALLTARNRSRRVALGSAELLAWSGGNQRRKKIAAAAASHASADVQNIAQVALTLLDRDGTILDLNLADRMGMVDALVAGGVLTSVSDPQAEGYPGDKETLVALSTVSISRLQELGLPEFHEGDVQWALDHQEN
ncbi:MAG TPA: hypothetical protein VHH73_16145 [Verrucomicrobiae bacterium]|nr:hypothetical protein [Verrucomicrobiae bacterium]